MRTPFYHEDNHYGFFAKCPTSFYNQPKEKIIESDKKALQIENYFDNQRNELFFAKGVVLVEGATEKFTFPYVSIHSGFDIDRYGISIIECGGKGNLLIFSKVAKAFNIPYVVVADEDIKDISLISDPEKIKKAEAQNKDHKTKNDALKAFVPSENLFWMIPNIEGVLGLSAAIKYLNNIGMDKINKYEKDLRRYLINELNKLDFIEVYNKDVDTNIVTFNIKGVFAQDAAIYLDKYNICVRAGNHCAKILDNVFNISNTVRISLSFYNNKEEIDLLINVLKNSSNIWKEIL